MPSILDIRPSPLAGSSGMTMCHMFMCGFFRFLSNNISLFLLLPMIFDFFLCIKGFCSKIKKGFYSHYSCVSQHSLNTVSNSSFSIHLEQHA